MDVVDHAQTMEELHCEACVVVIKGLDIGVAIIDLSLEVGAIQIGGNSRISTRVCLTSLFRHRFIVHIQVSMVRCTPSGSLSHGG